MCVCVCVCVWLETPLRVHTWCDLGFASVIRSKQCSFRTASPLLVTLSLNFAASPSDNSP